MSGRSLPPRGNALNHSPPCVKALGYGADPVLWRPESPEIPGPDMLGVGEAGSGLTR